MTERKAHSEFEEQLLTLLRTRACVRQPFKLTTGRTADFFIDFKKVTLSPEGHYLIGRVLFTIVENLAPPIHAVGGHSLGGDPLVSAVVYTGYLEGRNLPGFLIRRDRQSLATGDWVEGLSNIPKGGRVVLLKDVLTSGASTLQGVTRARDAGLTVAAMVTLVDREEGGRELLQAEGVELVSVFNLADFA